MNNTKSLNTTLIITAIVLGTAGCSKQARFFPDQSVSRPSQDMVEAQVAAAAREGGNLYDCHFSGESLNALGVEQLDAIVRGRQGAGPVTVHMQDGRDHDRFVGRMESVAAFLKDRGMRDDQIVFADKLNERMYAPAASGLSNLRKTDTDAEGSETMQYGASAGGESSSGMDAAN